MGGPSIKQHIGIVLHDFNAGGTEAIAFRLAAEWLKQGRAVTIIAGAPDGPMRSRVPEGAAVEILDPPVRRGRFSRVGLGGAMAPVLARVRPDVLFIPGNFHFILARAIRRQFPQLPIVAKVSNPLLPRLPARLRRVAAALARWLLAPVDALAFMSPELLGADADVIRGAAAAVIPEPNLPDGHAPAARVGPQSPPLILAIGRMEPQKNLALAIRAFAVLRARQPARLLILGEGWQRGALERLTRRLGLTDDVSMPGFAEDVGAVLATASLLLMTSRYEGYPAVLIEALAADVPVVSTDCSPSQRAVIASPLLGKVVDAPTPEALADAMQAVLAQPFATHGARAAGLGGHASSVSAARYLALFDATGR